MDDYIYSVAMTATDETYIYEIYRFDGDKVDTAEVELGELIGRYPSVRNNVDALVFVNEHAAEFFEEDQ